MMRIIKTVGLLWTCVVSVAGWPQLANTQVTVSSISYIRRTSSADLVTQANALLTSCAGTCEIHIPCGTYAVVSGTITITNPGVSIIGDGRSCVFINYAGENFLNRNSNSGLFFLPAAKISGFTLTCSSSSAQCIEAGDMTGFDLEDISLVGPAGATNRYFWLAGSSQGMVFQNNRQWMERAIIRNVHIGGFATNVHFLAPTPTGTGTDSFGYWQVNGLWSNQGSNTSMAAPPTCGNTGGVQSYGVVVDAGASVYNVLGWTGNVNSGCTTTADEYFHVQGTLQGVGFGITGENSGTAVTFAHVVGSTGALQFQGNYNVFAGRVVVDTIHYTNGLPAFWVRPTAGLAGVNQGVGGAGTIANWNGSGQTVNITPAEYLENDNPAVPAFMGYVEQTNGASSPIPVYDPRMSYCIGTNATYAPPTSVNPTWCVDGSGNESVKGQANATGFAVNGVVGFTGTKTSGSCTFVIKGGIITNVTGC